MRYLLGFRITGFGFILSSAPFTLIAIPVTAVMRQYFKMEVKGGLKDM
jgi:hypothetical protein